MQGLIIQCCGCGFSKLLNLDGNATEIERQVNETISKDGWRYALNRKDFICMNCIKGESNDYLYEWYFGKARYANMTQSYKKLLDRVINQIADFKRL